MSINDRFSLYLRTKNLTQRTLAHQADISLGTISRFIRGEAIGTDKLQAVLSACPDLSLEWIFRGTGPMCLSDVSIDNSQTLEYLRLISEKDRLIKEKDIIITELQRLLMEKS